MSSVVLVSGPPGAGKTTVAGALARRHERAVHLHTDDFWRSIVSGAIAPFDPASDRQNHVVLDVIAGAAYAYAAGGFTTVVDGVIGPWMLEHFRSHARRRPELPLHYVVLRPGREVALGRAQGRTAATALTDAAPVLDLWDQFADLGDLETHVLDTTTQAPAVSLEAAVTGLDQQRFRLRPPA